VEEEAFPDTGFTGGVIIPRALVEEIDARPHWGELRLGNQAIVGASYWRGRVAIGDLDLPTEIWALGDEFIIGRKVLDRMEVCFEFGERVRLRFDR